MRILILGAGRIGSAIASALADKNRASVVFWDIDPSRVPDRRPLAELVPEASVIFFCLPSWNTRAAAADIAAFLRPATMVISVAKGIERATQKTVDEILAETLPTGQPFGLLYGAMMAEEIQAGKLGVGMVASQSAEVRASLPRLFAGTPLRLVPTADVHAVAICGVLKNVYASAVGVAAGLDWSVNARGALLCQIVEEMKKVCAALKVSDSAPLSVAGLGDLIATVFSPHSHNTAVGKQLIAKVDRAALQSEGLFSLPSLTEMLGATAHHLPVLQALQAVVAGAPAGETFAKLLPE